MNRTDGGDEGTRLPSTIGPYKVIKKLGAGGMGEAFLASSEQDGLVVVKRIRADLAADPVYRARFRREVQAARAVSGDCTPAVVGAAPEAAHPWLATVYLEGTDLKALVSDGTGPLEELALRDLAGALAMALVSLHRVGLIHRDLKPSNVLMTDVGPRVIDFGIAKPLGNDFTVLTKSAQAMGTPAYMSPEQAKGLEVTPASDVFSLGAILVYAATGHLAFPGEGATAMLAVAYETPDMDGVPDGLRALIEACLDKTPENRPSPEGILSLLSATGEFTQTRRHHPRVGPAYGLLTLLLTCYFCGFLVFACLRHGLPLLIPPALAVGMIPPVWVMERLHRLRRITVQATVNDWGVKMRYGFVRIAYPWEELSRVALVRPVAARVPTDGSWSLVATMRPGYPGIQPKPLRLRPGNRVGLNLELTPGEAAVLAALLTRQRANTRQVEDGAVPEISG
ncbi:serine/threonine-protein kinase [Streptomyces sp. NPDC014861]|uniref:serine/threonine-protein kinase n=1 Tax=Streptomyces sp. NPDC014861 TaxID=3364923 RepID=UPI0036F4DD7F